jgi:hypothetical protein
MKTNVLWAIKILCAVLLVTGLASADTTLSHSQTRGDGAWAAFYVADTTSCALGTVTRIYVQSNTYTGTWDGAPADDDQTTITISVWDYCVNAEVSLLIGSTTQQELQVDPNLSSATLRSTIPALDQATGAVIEVSVDLIWSGTGKLIRDPSGYNEHFENLTIVSRSYGTFRDAVASGSLIVGGVELTLPSSLEGQTEKNARRETTIIRN